jgi:hypothetical protein
MKSKQKEIDLINFGPNTLDDLNEDSIRLVNELMQEIDISLSKLEGKQYFRSIHKIIYELQDRASKYQNKVMEAFREYMLNR